MNNNVQAYEVFVMDEFKKSAKHLYKKKKFKRLPTQTEQLIQELEKGNFSGVLLTQHDIPIPYEVYKKRLPNEDTNKGTSSGYRVIYLVATQNRVVGLLEIYYKKEVESLPDNYIQGLIDGFLLTILPDDED